jgi:TldD protein
MSIHRLFGFLILLTLPFFSAANPAPAQDDLMNILSEELEREMAELSKEDYPPYYLDYRVDDLNSYSIQTSFGSVTGRATNKGRVLTTMLRIGDFEFDNTHVFKGDFSMPEQSAVYATQLPYENDPDAIKQSLWLATDQVYKNALSSYTSLMRKRKEIEEDDPIPDFSKESPSVYYEPPFPEEDCILDEDEWISRLKEYTGMFKSDSMIFHSEAFLVFMIDRKYFVSSEGSRIVQNSRYTQLQIQLSIQHKGGSILPLNKSYTAFHPSDLPDHNTVIADLKDLYSKLQVLKNAPMAEPYAGPAILSPGAAGVFFHEIFGHRIEGHRLESFMDGQTFKEKIGTKVLPKEFNVYSDPTLSKFNDQDLIGSYIYDDQGVIAQKVNVVEKGILENFLMSRQPTREFANSSGHGRSQAGYAPVSRQSNLIIETTDPISWTDMRKQLIRECKKQKKEYGYYFKEVTGGLTITDRYNPNVFDITPIEVYRIYVDGRPDELVSGVDLIGTPLTMFSNIISGSDTREVFTGFCGAESGHVPVTTISPALFVRKIETQKTPEFDSKLPLLPSPDKEVE